MTTPVIKLDAVSQQVLKNPQPHIPPMSPEKQEYEAARIELCKMTGENCKAAEVLRWMQTKILKDLVSLLKKETIKEKPQLEASPTMKLGKAT